MAVTVTDVKQWHNGRGFTTTGNFALSGTYATNGDASGLAAKISGIVGTIDHVSIGIHGSTTAVYDPATAKLRVFKIAAGVFTELANGASYDADTSLPFVAHSR